MLKFLYDWLVLTPADIFAALLTCVLMLIPFAAGCGVGALVYVLMEGRTRSGDHPKGQYLAITTACVAGVYVAFVTGIGIIRLPVSIFYRLLGN